MAATSVHSDLTRTPFGCLTSHFRRMGSGTLRPEALEAFLKKPITFMKPKTWNPSAKN